MSKNLPRVSFRKDRDLGMEIIPLHQLFYHMAEPMDHDPTLPHKVDFFTLLMVESGDGIHKVDFHQHQLQAGDALLISKGQVHAFQKRPKYEGYLILFTESFLLQNCSPSVLSKINGLYNYHIVPPVMHNHEMNVQLIKELQKELNRDDTPLKEILAAHLTIYLLQIERLHNFDIQQPGNTNHYILFNKFRTLVENGYNNTRNAGDYAQLLAISYKHLNELCKSFTQKTAKEFIDDYVVLEIKRLLSSTTLSFKEISYSCGFIEPTNCRKFYINQTGESPSIFRQNL